MDNGPGIGEAFLGGRYTRLAQVKASTGGTKSYIGNKGPCRYCGESSTRYFRTEAHAFPEGLGNRWVISRDECDKCNELFSKYDDAIVRAVGPFLTLGGVKGKANKVRQTGRFPAILARRDGQDRPTISIHSANAETFTPALVSPFRWQDWAAPFKDEAQHPQTDEGKPYGWKRQELFAKGDGKLFDFINTELLPHLP